MADPIRYATAGSVELWLGDAAAALAMLPARSVDYVVTPPPSRRRSFSVRRRSRRWFGWTTAVGATLAIVFAMLPGLATVDLGGWMTALTTIIGLNYSGLTLFLVVRLSR